MLAATLLSSPHAVVADSEIIPPPPVHVVANTDSRAELRPCHCPGDPQGGVALRAVRFSSIRAMAEPSVIVDGGDWLPEPDDSLAVEKAQLMLEAMERLRYNAVGLGDLELERGPEFLLEAAQRLPLVCANLRGLEAFAAAIPQVRWVDAGGLRIAITGYVDPLLYYEHPVALSRSPDSLLVVDPAEALTSVLAELADADVVVILAHASGADISGHLPADTRVHLVVEGHVTEDATSATPLDYGTLIHPGQRSRTIISATLEYGAQGYAFKSQRIWDLKRGGKADASLEALIDTFEAEHGLKP